MGVDFAFLDSGTGGIPYMLSLKEKIPEASCVYLGDTAHFPYGEKSPEEVAAAASEAVALIQKKWAPKTLVVACNTISVTALGGLRARFKGLPIVGTVPAIKLAASVTRNKRVGLLATNATAGHPYSQKLIDDFAADCVFFTRGDPALVEFVEKKFFASSREERLLAVKPAVDYFLQNDCDTIILGCTHFTHIAQDIQDAAGSGVRVVDSREGVANQALRVFPGGQNALKGQERAMGEKSAGGKNGAADFELAGNSLRGQDAARSRLASNFVQDQKGAAGKNSSQDKNDGALPPDKSFFFTAASAEQEAEYRAMCEKFGIPFGGRV